MRISDWSSDVCSSDLAILPLLFTAARERTCARSATMTPNRGRSATRPARSRRRRSSSSANSSPPPGPMRSTPMRSEEHTSELQSLMRISYAVFCLNKKIKQIVPGVDVIEKQHIHYEHDDEVRGYA